MIFSPWQKIGLLVGAGALLTAALVYAFIHYGNGRYQEGVDHQDGLWRFELAKQENAARERVAAAVEAQRKADADAYAKRETIDAHDTQQTTITVEKVIHDSPSAAACVCDEQCAAALNGLQNPRAGRLCSAGARSCAVRAGAILDGAADFVTGR